VKVDHPDVAQLRCARDEGIEQDRRRRRGAVKVDLLTAPDAGNGFGRRDDAHQVSVAGSGPTVRSSAPGPRAGRGRFDVHEAIRSVGERNVRSLEAEPGGAGTRNGESVPIHDLADRAELERGRAFSGRPVEMLDNVLAIGAMVEDDRLVAVEPDHRLAGSFVVRGSSLSLSHHNLLS
jgi:hypothetical protein